MDERTPTDLAPDAETSPPAGFKRPRRSETLLVVDDDPWILRVTVYFLVGEEGYDVLPVTGGVEAMRIAETQDGPIHVLLTDVVMPGANGWMLAKRMPIGRPE